MDMAEIVLAVVIAFLLITAFNAVLAKKGRPSREDHPYAMRDRLFTQAEYSFLRVLDIAIGEELRVFGKVRIADVLKVSSKIPKTNWYQAFNKISAKHFDFVLVNPETTKIELVVELNDRSHRSNKRQARDEFVRNACQSANLRLIEIDAKRTYAPVEIRDLVNTARSELQATENA
ncbi:MAG: DUF2726 domain-containing protein [Pseudomonadota bacterium]